MTRSRWTLLVIAAVVVAAVSTALVVLGRGADYPDKEPAGLLFGPDRLPSLAGPPWARYSGLDGTGAVSRSWQADGHGTFSESVERHGSTLAGRYAYWANDPRAHWRADVGDQVTDHPLGVRLHADRALLFCASRVPPASAGGTPGCGVWELWGQYGQYTVDLNWMSSGSEAIPQDRFERGVADYDAVLRTALGK
jgi:hypothetical protein